MPPPGSSNAGPPRPQGPVDYFRPLPPSQAIRDARKERRVMLRRALLGRCPLCGTPGIRKGWGGVAERCRGCNLRFSRERGYHSGAAWLNLTVVLFTMSVVLLGSVVATQPDTPWGLVTALTVAAMLFVGVVCQPIAVALFLWVDLAYFRPLDSGDLAQNDPEAEVDRTGRPI